MGFFALLWANPLARKIILIVGAAVAIFGIWEAAAMYERSKGRTEGVQIGHSDAAQVEQQSLSTQQKAVDELKKELMPQIAEARAKADKAEIAAGLKDEVIRNLVNQRLQASQGVQQMTETQIAALVAKYTPRDLADCVATRPALLQEVQTRVAQVNDLSNAIAEEKKSNLNVVTLFNQEVQLRTRYQTEYTALFNWQTPKTRHIKCMFLWKCNKKTIPFPSPEQIQTLHLK